MCGVCVHILIEPFVSYCFLNKAVVTKKIRKNYKNGTFAATHFCIYLSSVKLLGSYMSLAHRKCPQRGRLGVKFLKVCGQVIGFA